MSDPSMPPDSVPKLPWVEQATYDADNEAQVIGTLAYRASKLQPTCLQAVCKVVDDLLEAEAQADAMGLAADDVYTARGIDFKAKARSYLESPSLESRPSSSRDDMVKRVIEVAPELDETPLAMVYTFMQTYLLEAERERKGR